MKALDLLAVGVGGAVGTALRIGLTPDRPPAGFPVATLVINVLGAGLLGLLVARLARHPESERAARLRLLLGTGLLGGFTTYSALAVDTVGLVRVGALGTATAYAVGTLVLGAAATGLGRRLGRTGRGP